MSRTKTVTLLLESDRQYFRDVLRGVARYARQVRGWRLRAEPSEPGGGFTLKEAVETDGVVLFLSQNRELDFLRERGTPFVNLSSRISNDDVPHVSNDGTTMARMAVEHFLERGLPQMAFCQLDNYSDVRSTRFEQEAARCGLPCHVFRVDYRHRNRWMDRTDRDDLDEWMAGLPKPVGVVGHNDIRGRHVIDSCQRLGLEVPDEVAVLGIDNELPHCELCDPPLSSIATAAGQIGFTAAELLDQLMDGKQPEELQVLVPPVGIVTRQSTDTIATADELIARTVRFIRDHADAGIDVSDVVEFADVSRTTLDNRFRRAIGHTPHEEIVRNRLRKARELLLESNMTLEQIAVRTGFRHAEYLGSVFRARYAQTPGEFRRQHGQGFSG